MEQVGDEGPVLRELGVAGRPPLQFGLMWIMYFVPDVDARKSAPIVFEFLFFW